MTDQIDYLECDEPMTLKEITIEQNNLKNFEIIVKKMMSELK